MIPMPPWRAMAMARRDSVTVSLAAEARGILIVSLRVNCVAVSTSVGITEDLPGRSSTSSNVRPSRMGPSKFVGISYFRGGGGDGSNLRGRGDQRSATSDQEARRIGWGTGWEDWHA